MEVVEKSDEGRNGKDLFTRSLGALFCVLCMVLSSVLVLGAPAKDAMADPESEYVPGELLIKFKDKATDQNKNSAKSAVDAKVIKNFNCIGVQHWKVGSGYDVEKALREFDKEKYNDIIEFVEPNYRCYADSFPTDPMRGEQWSMHNVGQTGGTNDADIDMLEYWNSPPDTETTEVVVAVIDTGVDYTHPDLDGVMWKNPGEYGKTPGVDDDSNGFVDDIYGYDFFNNDGDPMDDHGHGSHCAGVIAAERNNGVGVAGMSVKARIMAVKWLNSGGGGYVDGAIAAINYAASFSGVNKVKITSNSWGVGQKSKALETAIKNSGALFVASAGNSASSSFQYPAAYTLDNVISVAATDNKDALASFSNYGSSWVDLGAPGVSVYSCYKGGEYILMSGTSMSAPHVAGAAALVWSNYPTNSIAQTKAKIMDNVESETALQGKTVTGGKLNVQKMFSSSPLPTDTDGPGIVNGLAVGTGTETEYSLTLGWTSVAEDSSGSDPCYAYDLRYLPGLITSNFDWDRAANVTLEPNPKAAGNAETLMVTRLLSGTTYTFALKAIDELGNKGTISNLASGTTKTANWDIDIPIESGTSLYYMGMAYDSNGDPGLAIDMGSSLVFTHRSSNVWSTPETVATEGPGGMSLVWDGSTWIIVYGPGSLKVAKRNGANSWSLTMLERNNIGYDCKDIAAYNKNNIYRLGISYRSTSGLMYAEYQGGIWTKYLVDRGAACRYNAIEFDSTGQPAIAYCHYTGDNGNMLDIQKYAKRASGGSWNIETVASGVEGYGVLCDLDLDKYDTPYIACSGYAGSGSGWNFHFFTKAGGTWTKVDVGNVYGSDTSIAVDDSGDTITPYVAYTDGTEKSVFVAKGTLTDGTWSFKRETVDPGMRVNFYSILEFYHNSGTGAKKLGYCYGAYAGVSPAPRASGVAFAERDLLKPTSWG